MPRRLSPTEGSGRHKDRPSNGCAFCVAYKRGSQCLNCVGPTRVSERRSQQPPHYLALQAEKVPAQISIQRLLRWLSISLRAKPTAFGGGGPRIGSHPPPGNKRYRKAPTNGQRRIPNGFTGQRCSPQSFKPGRQSDLQPKDDKQTKEKRTRKRVKRLHDQTEMREQLDEIPTTLTSAALPRALSDPATSFAQRAFWQNGRLSLVEATGAGASVRMAVMRTIRSATRTAASQERTRQMRPLEPQYIKRSRPHSKRKGHLRELLALEREFSDHP